MVLTYADNSLAADITDGSYSRANRSGGGSDGNAYKTLNGALQACPAGGTVYVRGGTYHENYVYQHVAQGNGLRSCVAYIPRPLSLLSYFGEPAVIAPDPANPPRDENGNLNYGVYFAPYLNAPTLIDGGGVLSILGTRALGDNLNAQGNDTDTDVAVMIGGNRGPGPITVRRCEISQGGHCGIKVYDGGTAGPLTVEYCDIHDNGITGRDHGIYCAATDSFAKIFRKNRFRFNAGYGVQLYAQPQYGTVDNNEFDGNGLGDLLLAGSNHTVTQNTMTSDAQYANLYLFQYQLANLLISGNVMRGASPLNVRVDGTLGAGNMFSGNVWGSASPQWPGTSAPLPPGAFAAGGV